MNLMTDPVGKDGSGNDVYLKDIWPTNEEINAIVLKHISSEMYKKRYSNVFEGDQKWRDVDAPTGKMYAWDPKSTYIRNPTFFDNIKDGIRETFSLSQARVLALLGDSVTTDHISPAGSIALKALRLQIIQKQIKSIEKIGTLMVQEEGTMKS